MRRHFLLAAALLLMTGAAFAATQGGTMPVPLPLFPPNNWWNTDISAAPVDPSSNAFMATITTQMTNPTTHAIAGLHPDFGGDDSDNPRSTRSRLRRSR
jgi:hypothetical protein